MIHDSLLPFHPILAEWFTESFRQPTDVQLQAWDSIAQGEHTLIAAPTGSGKTLAALLPGLQRIFQAKLDAAKANQQLEQGVRLLYITPLKALNNDVHHHVVRFAEALDALAARKDESWPGLTAAVRTGDTPQRVRSAMVRKPPDILVTTPESLYLMLTSEKARGMLRTVDDVIVDEIHSMAGDKRGVHLALTLERLQHLCGRTFMRIGVSATQKPMDRVAAFLGGWEDDDTLRPVRIIESRADKTFDLRVTIPDPAVSAKDKEAVWSALTERILQEMEGTRSVLIFANSRRLCERLTQRLNDYCGSQMARSHHGSVSREKRLEVEQLLKNGDLRCLITTSSMELGIDVGHIDLVIQIDSPLDAASGIQRIGRAGHGVGEVSRGVIIARHRIALPEIAVLCRMIREREIEPIRIPRNRLDVLAQQIAAMISMEAWNVDRLLTLIRRCDSFHTFSREQLESLLQVISGYYPFVRPLIDWNRETDVVVSRPGTRMAAIMGTGTIPQSANYPIYHLHSGILLGDLEEEFIHESRAGDVFQLGAQSWVIREIKRDRIIVSEAENRFSEIPFWRNPGTGRSYELGERVGAFAAEVIARLQHKPDDPQTLEWLQQEYGLDSLAADSLMQLLRNQQAVSEVPTHRTVVIEHYVDLTNQTHIILHNYWGRSLNLTWQILMERLCEKVLSYRPYMCAKDNGIEIILRPWDQSKLQVQAFWQITPEAVEPLLLEAIGKLPMFAITFRRIAEIGLLLSRRFERTPAWQNRLRSEELFKAALPFAGQFPFLQAAIEECAADYLDAKHLRWILEDIEAGKIEIHVHQNDYPSPFATQFMFDFVNMQMYETDAFSSELQMQLMNVSAELAGSVFGVEAVRNTIEPEVLEAQQARFNIKPQNAKELFTLLKKQGDFTLSELEERSGQQVGIWLNELQQQALVSKITLGSDSRWICRDELETYAQFPQSAASVTFVLDRFVENRLSFTERQIQQRYALTSDQTEMIISQWHELRRIQPSLLEQEIHGESLWSSRKMSEQLIRDSLQHFLHASEPVDPVRLELHLLERHQLMPSSRLKGIDGLRSALRLLQGMFLPYLHWEQGIFPSRVDRYRKEDLDVLCASGEIIWIGRRVPGEKEEKVAFFFTDTSALYTPFLPKPEASASTYPELLKLLRSKGATFLTRLAAETNLPPSELLSQLFELVWEGHVSNDQYSPLRNYHLAKGKLHTSLGSGLGRWYATAAVAAEAVAAEAGHLNEGVSNETESALAWAHHLLKVQGIVTRDAVAAYAPFSWEVMVTVLRRLEELGKLTRGLFVKDIPTLQFLERETITALRKPYPTEAQEELTVINAMEPANLYGNIVPWPEFKGVNFARKSANYMIFYKGHWVGWLENYGRKIFFLHGEYIEEHTVQPDKLLPVFRQMMHNAKLKKIVIHSWNGKKAADSEQGRILMKYGAERDRDFLVLWPSSLGK